jgi:predicted porin
MKKTIIASAIAAVVAAPAAFADIKITGQVTTEIKSVENAADVDMTEAADLFIAGSEDLGNGMKAFFKMGTSPDGAGGSLAEDDRYLGVSGDFGTVMAGRFEALDSQKGTDMANSLASSEVLSIENKPTGTGQRGNKGIRYTSPNFNGITVEVEGFMDGDDYNSASNTDDFDSTGFMVQYANAGLTVRYVSTSDDTANSDVKVLGASYKMGDITVAITDVDSDTSSEDSTTIGAKYTMGANSIGAAFTASSGTAAEEGDFIIKGTHALSKQTSVWVGFQNDDDSNDTTVVGVKHAF